MTLILLVNIVLAAIVFAVVMGLAAWAHRGSYREGRLIEDASRKQWVRPTISLHHASARPPRRVRPFQVELGRYS